MDWFMGKITGNHGFNHQDHGVFSCKISRENQSIDLKNHIFSPVGGSQPDIRVIASKSSNRAMGAMASTSQ